MYISTASCSCWEGVPLAGGWGGEPFFLFKGLVIFRFWTDENFLQ